MERLRKLGMRRMAVIGGLLIALIGGGVAFTMARAQANEPYANRMGLGKDIVKLAIVAMANQTPITRTDAQTILPVLREVKAQDAITEAKAAELDGKLQQALSSELKQAVSVVRLPEPRPEMIERAKEFAARRHFRNPAKYGPPGRAFDRLIEFIQESAK